jgi:hypothetical protein
VYEVWAVKKVPGEMKQFGVFDNETDAWLFHEEIKYFMGSVKIKTKDKRI